MSSNLPAGFFAAGAPAPLGSALFIASGRGSPEPAQFSGNAEGIPVALNAGDYAVSQETALGYHTTLSADCQGTIGPGGEKQLEHGAPPAPEPTPPPGRGARKTSG